MIYVSKITSIQNVNQSQIEINSAKVKAVHNFFLKCSYTKYNQNQNTYKNS